jgi:hypothetical protein
MLNRFKHIVYSVLFCTFLFPAVSTFAQSQEAGNKLVLIERTAETAEFEYIITPYLRNRFGSYDDVFPSTITLANMIKWHAHPNLDLVAELRWNVQDDFGDEDYISPGFMGFMYKAKPVEGMNLFISGGLFGRVRDTISRIWDEPDMGLYQSFGLDMHIYQRLWDRIILEARVGYTGKAKTVDYIWETQEVNQLTYYARGWLILSRKLNLTGGASIGRYLYDDHVLRFDLIRHFGKVRFGFYAFMGSEPNGGVQVQIPLYPKQVRYGKFALRTSDYFNYEYRGKSLPREGLIYSTWNEYQYLFLKP